MYFFCFSQGILKTPATASKDPLPETADAQSQRSVPSSSITVESQAESQLTYISSPSIITTPTASNPHPFPLVQIATPVITSATPLNDNSDSNNVLDIAIPNSTLSVTEIVTPSISNLPTAATESADDTKSVTENIEDRSVTPTQINANPITVDQQIQTIRSLSIPANDGEDAPSPYILSATAASPYLRGDAVVSSSDDEDDLVETDTGAEDEDGATGESVGEDLVVKSGYLHKQNTKYNKVRWPVVILHNAGYFLIAYHFIPCRLGRSDGLYCVMDD
jgi:hypothetical protein